MEDIEYLDRFEQILEDGLVNLCKNFKLLDGELLQNDDIDDKWNKCLIQGYVEDAVDNFNQYPEVTIAWPAYLGMAVAHDWDRDFELFKEKAYKDYYGSRGFDDMDERCVAYLEADEAWATKLKLSLQSLAVAAQGLMRHEKIEVETERGFYILVRIYSVMFRIGAAIELHRLGYRNVRVV